MAKKKKAKSDPSLYSELTPQVTSSDQIVNTARRAKWRLTFSGVDVTDSVKKDLISIEIKDVEDTEADDLQIKLADRDGSWLQNWLNETVSKGAAGAKGMQIKVKIGSRDHTGKIVEQSNGVFILDSMRHEGPPAVATIKATSVDFSNTVRTEKKDKSWKNLKLKKLTQEVASRGKLKYYYQPSSNPKFKKITQKQESGLAFLIRCARDKGYSVKISGKNMVVYDPKDLEGNAAIVSFTYRDGQYSDWAFDTGSADECYDYCTVKYTNPKTGKLIKATYKDASYETNKEHTGLNITNKKVTSKSEAKTYAMAQLNLKNKFERTVSLTIPGNPSMMSGLTVQLHGCGYWSGKYMIHEATHSISSSGYTTRLDMRRINK